VAVLLGKQNFGRIIDWSPDGKFIVYSDASVAQTPLGLYRLSVETRETQQLTVPPATLVGGDQQPAFSPDGQNLAFVRMFDWGAHDIYVMPTGGGEAKRLTFDYRFVFGLTWTPDGRSIVFASYRRGTTDLWRISAAGGKPERLGINGAFPALSLHGQMLAYVAESGGANSMWRINLSDSPGRTGSRIKVLSTTTKEINPQISPDGKKIVFSSDRSGANEIWVCESDGSNLLQLTKVGHISGTRAGRLTGDTSPSTRAPKKSRVISM
jgi:Tol biopolymer transport system component